MSSLDRLRLQDHDPTAEIGLLALPQAFRFLGYESGYPFRPLVDEKSAGNVIGAVLWRHAEQLLVPTGFRATGRPLRGVPAWAWAFPAQAISARELPDGTFDVTLLPVGDGAFAIDERFEPIKARSSAPCAAGTSGVLLAATDERSQQPVFFPTGGRLTAPHWAGSAADGSLVHDSDRDHRARLQTLTRVWRVPKTCGGLLYGPLGALGLVFQIGISKGGVRGGVLADGGGGAGAQRLGGLSNLVGGPFRIPGAGDKHAQGVNEDGDSVGPVELSSDAIWHLDGERDAPFLFSTDPYEVEHGSPGVPQDVELVYDPAETHPTPCGAKAGRFRWQTRVPLVPVEEEHPDDGGGGGGGDRPKKPKKPKRPWATPQPKPKPEEHWTTPRPTPNRPDPEGPSEGPVVIPVPTGGVRPDPGPLVIPIPTGGFRPDPEGPATDGPSDDAGGPRPDPCRKQLPFLWSPTALGLGTLILVASILDRARRDLRHDLDWRQGDLPKGRHRPPQIARVDVIGRPSGATLGGWERTTEGPSSKSPTGTGSGVVAIGPSERTPEDRGPCDPPVLSEVQVALTGGTRIGFGEASIEKGKIVDGFDAGLDEDGHLTVRCVDEDGDPDETHVVEVVCDPPSIALFGETIVDESGFRHPPGWLQGFAPMRTGSPVVRLSPGSARADDDATNLTLDAEVDVDLVSHGAALGNDSRQLTDNVATTIGTNVVSGVGSNLFLTEFQPRQLEASGVTFSNASTNVTGPAGARWITGRRAPKVGDLVGHPTPGYRTVVRVNAEGDLDVDAPFGASGTASMNVIESPTVALGTIPAITTRVLRIYSNTTLHTVDNAPSTAASTLAYAGRPLAGAAACDPVWFYPWICRGPSGTTVFLSTQRTTPLLATVTPATYGEHYRRLSPVLNYSDGSGNPALYEFSESGQGPHRTRQWEEAPSGPFAPLSGADPVGSWTWVSLHKAIPPTATRARLTMLFNNPAISNSMSIRASGRGSTALGRAARLVAQAGDEASDVVEVVTDWSQAIDVVNGGASPGDPCMYLWVVGYDDDQETL